jgi:hypothetical protein
MKAQLILVVAALVVGPLAAQAGPVGEINRDIGRHQSESRAASPPAAAPAEGCSLHCPQVTLDEDFGDPYDADPIGEPVVIGDRGDRLTPPNETLVPFGLDFFASYQNVTDSDGALNGDLRLSHGPVAAMFSSSSYFESDRLEKGEPAEQSRLTRWDLSVQGRALAIGEATVVWVGVGLGQLHGTGFENVTGLSLGGQLHHRLGRGLGIEAGVRGMMYSDDINAAELRAGITASVLHVGYRYFELNVGPPLAGPEVGISLHF